MGRPVHNAIPPSLLDKTLCEFRYNIHNHQPTDQDHRDFHRVQSAMIETYPDEPARRDHLSSILSQILPHMPSPGSILTYTDDGVLYRTLSELQFIYYMQELKNEIGSILGEPNVELARCYLEFVRVCLKRLGDKKVNFLNFPAILLAQVGKSLSSHLSSKLMF